MKNPDLIPIYAHLLCNETLSEVVEDAAQHLFQRAVDAGLVQPDEDHDLCSELTMARIFKVSVAGADVGLHSRAKRLEALLLQEFPTKIRRH